MADISVSNGVFGRVAVGRPLATRPRTAHKGTTGAAARHPAQRRHRIGTSETPPLDATRHRRHTPSSPPRHQVTTGGDSSQHAPASCAVSPHIGPPAQTSADLTLTGRRQPLEGAIVEGEPRAAWRYLDL